MKDLFDTYTINSIYVKTIGNQLIQPDPLYVSFVEKVIVITIKSKLAGGFDLLMYKKNGVWYPNNISHRKNKISENSYCHFCKEKIENVHFQCVITQNQVDEFYQMLKDHPLFRLKELFI